MSECITKPLVSNFSGCLVENPDCRFAVRMGFSYQCSHPDHKSFQGTSREELKRRYDNLRESRRNAYFDRQMELYKNNPELVDLLNYLKQPLVSARDAAL